MLPLGRDEVDYTSCYCEENVYRLCERIPVEQRPHFFVVFISNAKKQVPLFSQRTNADRDWVIWDYHVILVSNEGVGSSWVYDLDSTLEFPCRFETYFLRALPDRGLPDEFHRSFRVIPCAAYLSTLSTDRRHMKKDEVVWLAEPPSWDPPFRPDLGHNLERFISMVEDHGEGIAASQVFNQRGFGRCFGFVPS